MLKSVFGINFDTHSGNTYLKQTEEYGMLKRSISISFCLSLIVGGFALSTLTSGCASSETKQAEAAPAEVTTPKTPTARVWFIEPENGATVGKKFKVKMGVEGFEIGTLGDLTQGKGHHHIIINKGPVKEGEVIPADAKHIHFGKGQTEAEIKLKPGHYNLTLQFADGAHRSYGEKLSSTIHVMVH